ncbi:hypothetical protein IWQ60_010514 [Tieghemiomyces parasiticus]|uniref:PB1 domain-containing protein n=1 Tax=Tieghemiomyces parasiticus TaxID=78921 RepID=A0A9W7ZLF0_9FUNG|nr:hypothetical protein IWQ60_010514 [Tieghemiomyces parasiticus]
MNRRSADNSSARPELVQVKCRCGSDIRRFAYNPEKKYDGLVRLLFREFQSKLSPTAEHLKLRYTDDEGDLVCLDTDADLQRALALSPTYLKLRIYDTLRIPPPDDNGDPYDQVVHHARQMTAGSEAVGALRSYLAFVMRRFELILNELPPTRDVAQKAQPTGTGSINLRDDATNARQGASARAPTGPSRRPHQMSDVGELFDTPAHSRRETGTGATYAASGLPYQSQQQHLPPLPPPPPARPQAGKLSQVHPQSQPPQHQSYQAQTQTQTYQPQAQSSPPPPPTRHTAGKSSQAPPAQTYLTSAQQTAFQPQAQPSPPMAEPAYGRVSARPSHTAVAAKPSVYQEEPSYFEQSTVDPLHARDSESMADLRIPEGHYESAPQQPPQERSTQQRYQRQTSTSPEAQRGYDQSEVATTYHSYNPTGLTSPIYQPDGGAQASSSPSPPAPVPVPGETKAQQAPGGYPAMDSRFTTFNAKETRLEGNRKSRTSVDFSASQPSGPSGEPSKQRRTSGSHIDSHQQSSTSVSGGYGEQTSPRNKPYDGTGYHPAAYPNHVEPVEDSRGAGQRHSTGMAYGSAFTATSSEYASGARAGSTSPRGRPRTQVAEPPGATRKKTPKEPPPVPNRPGTIAGSANRHTVPPKDATKGTKIKQQQSQTQPQQPTNMRPSRTSDGSGDHTSAGNNFQNPSGYPSAETHPDPTRPVGTTGQPTTMNGGGSRHQPPPPPPPPHGGHSTSTTPGVGQLGSQPTGTAASSQPESHSHSQQQQQSSAATAGRGQYQQPPPPPPPMGRRSSSGMVAADLSATATMGGSGLPPQMMPPPQHPSYTPHGVPQPPPPFGAPVPGFHQSPGGSYFYPQQGPYGAGYGY